MENARAESLTKLENTSRLFLRRCTARLECLRYKIGSERDFFFRFRDTRRRPDQASVEVSVIRQTHAGIIGASIQLFKASRLNASRSGCGADHISRLRPRICVLDNLARAKTNTCKCGGIFQRVSERGGYVFIHIRKATLDLASAFVGNTVCPVQGILESLGTGFQRHNEPFNVSCHQKPSIPSSASVSLLNSGAAFSSGRLNAWWPSMAHENSHNVILPTSRWIIPAHW
nr:hypothetical protein [Brucella intermedia]